MGGRELRDRIGGAVYGFVIGNAVRVVASSFDSESQSDCLRDIADAICESSLDLNDEVQMIWCITKVLTECSNLDSLDASCFKDIVANEFIKWYDSCYMQAVSVLNDGIEKYRKLHKFVFWSSAVLAGNRTSASLTMRPGMFWSSAVLTGNRTSSPASHAH